MDFKKEFKTPTVKYHHTLTKKPDAAAFERHCHTDYELLYVVNGAGKYVTEGREYPILPGTLLFQRPFEFHSVIPDENVPYERYVLTFDENPVRKNGSLLAQADVLCEYMEAELSCDKETGDITIKKDGIAVNPLNYFS